MAADHLLFWFHIFEPFHIFNTCAYLSSVKRCRPPVSFGFIFKNHISMFFYTCAQLSKWPQTTCSFWIFSAITSPPPPLACFHICSNNCLRSSKTFGQNNVWPKLLLSLTLHKMLSEWGQLCPEIVASTEKAETAKHLVRQIWPKSHKTSTNVKNLRQTT